MEAVTLNKLSIAEYILLSQQGNQKYEYHNGNIFAMAGGTINHSTISTNILAELVNQLLANNAECRPFNSDARLHIAIGNKILYPNTMVVCGEIERAETEKESITNPKLIVEVLSESTESYDRGDKFYFYQQIPSLKEYVLVAQNKQQVDVFKRGDENLWSFKRYDTSNKNVKFETITTTIDIETIYRNVVFENQNA